MMKFTGAIGGVLSALVVVPAIGLGQHGGDQALHSLEKSLTKTVETIELLVGLRDAADEGEPITTRVAVSLTEPALQDGRERDERLDELRSQVGLLQQELDLVEARALGGVETQNPAGLTPVPPRMRDEERLTVGLDTSGLAVVRDLPRPDQSSESDSGVDDEDPVEFVGYSADALRQAQTCYRAGQYARGLALLSNDETVPGLYWRARCLERLERNDEALALYERVAAREDAGSYAERARTNAEFVRWRQRLGKARAEASEEADG